MKQLSDYKLLEKNPFPAKEGGIERTAANIKRLPKMLEFRPIIVDSENIIQAGNKRFQALLLLGYKEVQDNWIKEAKDYTAHELKELVLLDNVDEGVWDLEILELEYPDIDIEDLGIEVETFEKFEGNIDDFFEESEDTAKEKELICPHCKMNVYSDVIP